MTDPEPPSPSPWAAPDGTPPAAGSSDARTVVVPGPDQARPAPELAQAPPPATAASSPDEVPTVVTPPEPVSPTVAFPGGNPFAVPPAQKPAPLGTPPPGAYLPGAYPNTPYPPAGYPPPGYPPPGQPLASYPPSYPPAPPSYPPAGQPQPPYPAAAGSQPPGYGPPGYPPPPYGQTPFLGPGSSSNGPSRGVVISLVVGGLVLVLLVVTGLVYLGRAHLAQSSETSSPAATGTAAPEPTDPDGSVPTAPPGTPSTEAWAVRINSYCRVVDLQLKAVPEPQSKSPVQRVLNLRATATILRTMNQRLRGMQVPAADRADYTAMMTAWDQVPIYYDQAAKAAGKNDEQAFRTALTRSQLENEKGNAIANRLGLTDCAGAGGLPDGTGGSSRSSGADV